MDQLLAGGGGAVCVPGPPGELAASAPAPEAMMTDEDNLNPDAIVWGRGFAFQSDAWQDLQMECCELTHVFRQADHATVHHLYSIRVGGADVPAAVSFFNSTCLRPIPDPPCPNGVPTVRPTSLYSKNADVDREPG